MSHQQYTSLTREIPENDVIETRYGAAVVIPNDKHTAGVSVALVYQMTSGAYILPPNARRVWLWNGEVASW